jgi:Ca-activated chloride channel family protein
MYVLAAVAIVIWGCGEDFAISGQTVGLVRLVRPGVEISREGSKRAVLEDTRLIDGTHVVADQTGRAILDLDSGARVVVDALSDVAVKGMDVLVLEEGRLWVEAGEDEQVRIELAGGGSLRASSTSISIVYRDGRLETYSASGELTYDLEGGKGLAREGEILSAEGGEAKVEPAELWTDWTGGLAEAGPRPSDTPMGIGEIFARRPGGLGVTRMPLVIRRHDVRVTIRGDLAVTETVQEFFNPASDTLEGIYKLRIPEDAVLQRFAVDRNGKLVDGYIKEKAKARADYQSHVYEGSTHDPALLEWTAPGKFRARIYPIKPGEVRVVAFRYVQWLRPSGADGRKRTYKLPMGSPGVPPLIGEFSLFADLKDVGTQIVQAGLGARVDEGKVVFTASDFRPKSDFYLELLEVHQEDLEDDQMLMATTEYEGEEGLLNESGEERYFYSQFLVRPEKLDLSPTRDLRVAIVTDLSAATDPGLADLGLTFVDSLLKQLDEEDSIAVHAGDLEATLVGAEGAEPVKATAAAKEQAIDALSRRATGGATDIGALITQAASIVGGEPGGVVVYVGDAFPTVGEMDLQGLLDRLSKLPHAVRLYGVALGDESNVDLLDGLCSGSGRATRVANRIEAAETAYRILSDASVPVFTDVTYEVEGEVERLYPRRAITLRVNEPLSIIGRITGEDDPEAIRVKGRLGAKRFEVRVRTQVEEVDDHGDLKLRWATRRLEALTQANAGREALVELGTRFQIITPFTSFYVPPADEAEALPVRPPFEIFIMPGEQVQQQEQGGLKQMLFGSLALGLSLLPYGCARASKEAMDEAPESAEEEWGVQTEQQAQPAMQRHSGEEGQMGEMARDEDSGGEYGIREKGDLAEGEEAEVGLDGLGTIGKGGGGGTGSGYGSGSGGLRGGADKPKKKKAKSSGSWDMEDRKASLKDGSKSKGLLGILSSLRDGDDSFASPYGAYYDTPALAPVAPLSDWEANELTVKEDPTSLAGGVDTATIKKVSVDNAASIRACYEDQLAIYPDLEGRVEVKVVVGAGGRVIDADVMSSSLDNDLAESCILAQIRSWNVPAGGMAGVSVAKVPFNFKQGTDLSSGVQSWDNFGMNANPLNLAVQTSNEWIAQQAEPVQQQKVNLNANQFGVLQLKARKTVCTSESNKPLADRVAVWRERLGAHPTVGMVVAQFHQARRNCEIQTMQDRRAYARLALRLLEGPNDECTFMNRMKAYPGLVDYIRKKILQRVKTPYDLMIVRQVCDNATEAEQKEIDGIVESKKLSHEDKIKGIKKLAKIYPTDMKVKLVLLDLLEDAPGGKRLGEAKRLAEDLRHHPYADDRVRTRVGEFYSRIDKPGEAKRCFSEIVEFSPYEPAARRRLGDLYRTYGWYEDAYRQYETLSTMVPSDETVLILMAEAAALAGRVDEAVRLAERVSQSASAEGILTPGDVARLFNGLRLIEMRVAARQTGDEKKVKDLMKRSRRAGVLRDASGLRVVLKWDHPDVHLDLLVKDQEGEFGAADRLAEEFGVEWLMRKKSRPGPIVIQVARTEGSVVKESKAVIWIIRNEGEEDETVEKIEVAVTDKKKEKLAWEIGVDGTVTETEVTKEKPITAKEMEK